MAVVKDFRCKSRGCTNRTRRMYCDACLKPPADRPQWPPATAAATPRAPFPGRLAITLPWTALAPDNQNTGVAGEGNREKRAAFNAAKQRARDVMRAAYDGEPFAGPARVTATFWFPDNRPRDPLNFAKALLDAMKGVLVTDDKWQVVRTATFDTGEPDGIDRDRPRCELVVEVKL